MTIAPVVVILSAAGVGAVAVTLAALNGYLGSRRDTPVVRAADQRTAPPAAEVATPAENATPPSTAIYENVQPAPAIAPSLPTSGAAAGLTGRPRRTRSSYKRRLPPRRSASLKAPQPAPGPEAADQPDKTQEQ